MPLKRLTRPLVGWVPALAALAALAPRLPFLNAPLSPDEGGFLLVAGQWHAGGGSLYGDYWVDRPPLLIGEFAVAAGLGGTVGLRLLGCLAVVAVVLLSALIGHLVSGRTGAAWAAAAGAAFVTTPLFDARQVSGELLAIPWVLAGISAVLAARHRDGRARGYLVALAGACAAAALLVKQSFADALVFALVVLVLDGFRRRSQVGLLGLARDLAHLGLGGAGLTGVVLAAAWVRGTVPTALWDAVVVFRAEAGQVITSSASAATADRLDRYPQVLLVTGAFGLLMLLVVLLVRLGRGMDSVTAASLVMVMWESSAIVMGGSYWLHYLLGLVPGLVLITSLVTGGHGHWPVLGRSLVAYAAAAAVVAVAVLTVAPPAPEPSQVAGEWLESHRVPGDTAVVMLGQPNVLAEAGVESPYQQLWSLPVRVRDPHLHDLSDVLKGSQAPVWLLVWKGEMATWGITPDHAEAVVARRYRPVASVCGYLVYLRRGVHRSHPTQACPDAAAASAGEGRQP